MNANILLTPPAVEPVSLAEMKAHARISGNADDDLLTTLLKGARQWVEAYTRRALISQTWCLYLSGAPRARKIVLPRGPLLSVTKIETYDDFDRETDWAAENYFVNKASAVGEVVLREGACWPALGRCANGMVVTYVAGYGASALDVPDEVKLAIKQLALHWYEHRGEAETSSAYAMAPMTVQAVLAPYRLLGVGGACA